MACSINENWKIGIAQREGKAKFLKAWKCGSTLLAQRLVTKVPSKLRFIAGTRKRLGHFDLLAYWTAAILFPLFSTPFPYFLFLPAWLKLPWILFFLSADEIILRQFQLVLPANFAAYRPKLLAFDFSPNDAIGSRSNGGHLENSNINNRRTVIAFIPLSSLFPRGEPLFPFPLIIILELNLNSEIIQSNFKTCLSQICLSPQRNYSETISKLVFAKNSALQSQPSRSPLLTKWSYWLSLNRRTSWNIEYK